MTTQKLDEYGEIRINTENPKIRKSLENTRISSIFKASCFGGEKGIRTISRALKSKKNSDFDRFLTTIDIDFDYFIVFFSSKFLASFQAPESTDA